MMILHQRNGYKKFNKPRKNQMWIMQTIKLQDSLIGLISKIKPDFGFGVIKKLRTISWRGKKKRKQRN